MASKPQIVSSALRPPLSRSKVASSENMEKFKVVMPTAYRTVKRIIDFVAALTAMILLSPLFLLIYLAIKLDDGGPAIIIQNRIGLGGKAFSFYKFRSMTLGTNHQENHKKFAQQVIRGEITKGPKSNGGLLKPTGDGRVITRVGKIIRKTSTDELPQLFNILKGDMSFVGPRPSMDYEVEVYYDNYLRRLEVLPGITGLAQVNGRSSIPFSEIVNWDLKYIENLSFSTDLGIVLKTIPVVFGMKHTG